MDKKSIVAAPGFMYDKLGLGALLYGYAVLVGAAYLLAFWRPFGFEIFSFLSLSDFVTAPLSRMSILLIYPLIIAAIFFGKSESVDRVAANALYVILPTYFVMVSREGYVGWAIFKEHAFYFRNEPTVFLFIAVLSTASMALIIRSIKARRQVHILLLGLMLVQVALSLAAGYRDGKTVFNGAENIHFLRGDDICSTSDGQRWVYVAHYSNRYFFMNAYDKSICIRESEGVLVQPRETHGQRIN